MRVSYPDMIGVDRGRDVLIDQLGAATEHGLAFCRAVYHTSPRGDVVPVQGGLEAGLPDITVYPDLATITPLRGSRTRPGASATRSHTDGERAPESPRTVAAHGRGPADGQLGYRLVCGPELEFFVCEQGPDGTVAPVRERARQRLRGRPQGRPAGPAAAHAAPAAGRAAAGHRRQPRVLAAASSRSTSGTPTCSTPPTGRSGSSPPCRRSPACRGCSPRSWPSRSTTRAGPDSTCTSRWPTTAGRNVTRRPRGRRRAVGGRPGTRWPACCGTRPR